MAPCGSVGFARTVRECLLLCGVTWTSDSHTSVFRETHLCQFLRVCSTVGISHYRGHSIRMLFSMQLPILSAPLRRWEPGRIFLLVEAIYPSLSPSLCCTLRQFNGSIMGLERSLDENHWAPLKWLRRETANDRIQTSTTCCSVRYQYQYSPLEGT